MFGAMTANEDRLREIDVQIADFKKEGLVQTAATLSRLREAIAGGRPLDDMAIMATFAEALEGIERRIAEVESREA